MPSVITEAQQVVLLEYMLGNSALVARLIPILKPSYFDHPYSEVVRFVKQYYTEYNEVPTPDIVYAETNTKLDYKKPTLKTDEYILKVAESFAKKSALKEALLKSVDLLDDQKYGEIEQHIRDALELGVHKDIGVVYTRNIKQRLAEQTHNENVVVYSSGYKKLDQYLDGGIKSREINLFMANSGGGKSLTLANIANNIFKQNGRVLYLSFELFQDRVDKRLHSIVGGISPDLIEQQPEVAAAKIEQEVNKYSGEIIIRYLPAGTTPLQIRSYLKTLESEIGYIPEVLILDHIDLIYPDQRVPLSDVFTKDKLVIESVRNIAVEYNLAVLTASQQNRSAVNAETIDHSHIAGGYSKIQTADNVISIIFDPILAATGRAAFQMVKTRNSDGVSKFVGLKWDYTTLSLKDSDEDIESIEFFIERGKQSNDMKPPLDREVNNKPKEHKSTSLSLNEVFSIISSTNKAKE